jgi:hypothetical protein
MYCLCVNVYCHRVTTQLQLINILYRIQGSDSLDCLNLEGKTAETSVTSYQPTSRNIPEGHLPQIHDGGSLKSCKCLYVFPSGEQNAGQYDKMTILPPICLASWRRVATVDT